MLYDVDVELVARKAMLAYLRRDRFDGAPMTSRELRWTLDYLYDYLYAESAQVSMAIEMMNYPYPSPIDAPDFDHLPMNKGE